MASNRLKVLAAASASLLGLAGSARAAAPACWCGYHESSIVHALPANAGYANATAGGAGRELLIEAAPPSAPANLGAFGITINAGAGLAGNAPALAAFNRAAARWASRISDPITVTIDANLANLGAPTIIAQAGSVDLQGGYDEIVDQLKLDAAAHVTARNNAIVQLLPSNATFTATLPAGRTLRPNPEFAAANPTLPPQTNIIATKANLKAMGFADLDADFGVSDGQITFNSTFNFDYDNRDGVGFGQVDFETAATHEIGHILGFISAVDDVAGGPTTSGDTQVSPTPLDLYRFARDGGPTVNPVDITGFSTNPRNLVPGTEANLDDLAAEYALSTGLNTLDFPFTTGTDGRQASHWKDNDLTGTLIGTMDPTLGSGDGDAFASPLEFFPLTDADFRALDLIGWNVEIPEPSSLGLLAAAGVGLLGRRRRHR